MTVDSLTPTLALPTKRDEAWRYAPHRTLAELSFGPSSGRAGSVPADLLDDVVRLEGLCVVIVDGVVDAARSRLGSPVPGVTVASRATAIGADRFAPAPDTEVQSPADAFVALNAAHGVDGALIDIGSGVVLDAPIHVVDVSPAGGDGSASCTQTHVRLGAGSSATVVETRISAGSGFGGSNVRTVVSLGEGAQLEHVVLQDLAGSQVHLGRVEVEQATSSTFRARSFNLGGAYGRLEYHVVLSGPEASADLAGLYLGSGEQVLDQQVAVVHAAENCVSRQAFRGVLDDRSTGVFNGGIDVRPGADGTDASQSNDNLLLSVQAEVNTQPRLEILADEVSCTHGATVGRLDEDALYYLRTRGVRADDARRLLINGFANQVVDQVGAGAVRTWIADRLGRHGDE